MHWAAGSQVKVARARNHFIELHDAVRSWFVDGRDYEKVPDADPVTGDHLLRLHWLQPIPLLDWGGIAGDVIHNLRSALDVAIAQLVWAKTPTDTSRGFPVFPDQRSAEAASLADIARCSPTAVDIIKHANRHEGDTLRLLQQLDNSGKHHVLTTVAYGPLAVTTEVSPEDTRLLFPDGLTSPSGLAMAMRMSRMAEGGPTGAEGAVLSRIPAELGGKITRNPQLTFDVAINEPQIEPDSKDLRALIRTLYDQLLLVEDIVQQFAVIP